MLVRYASMQRNRYTTANSPPAPEQRCWAFREVCSGNSANTLLVPNIQ
jgi:hypothetical protein